jgi:hypothetical protein
MRRVVAALAALFLVSVPSTALAQSAAPSVPAGVIQVAPGVTAIVVATMSNGAPAIIQLRFDPGASFDLPGGPDVALVAVDQGAIDGTTTIPLTVYDPSGASHAAAPNVANTFSSGEYFLVPPNAPGHIENNSTAVAAVSIATLVIGASAGGGPSASPNG